MSETLQHLVLVRHGESEGDRRRATWRRGEPYETNKTPDEEGLTARGFAEGAAGGKWLTRNILLGGVALGRFDLHYVAAVLRNQQSAGAMNLSGAVWQEDVLNRLYERNRGRVRGLTAAQHKDLYSESYAQMLADRLHWIPPGGQSILDVCENWTSFYKDIQDMRNVRSVIVVGNRDSMWASMKPLEGLSDEELDTIDTDSIHNGQIWYYTSLNPVTKQHAPQLMWKYTVDPMHPETSTGWQILPRIAERFEYVA